MAINFPTSLDTLTNPLSTDYLNSPSHAGQHANANDAIEALEAKVGINSSAVTTSHDYLLAGLGGTVKAYVDALTRYSNLQLATGQMINGKIVVTVTSNNITLALKGADGNDPSATNPVYCKIGGIVRSVTAALSVTKNAGTNWFASGATKMATYEIDYFAYLGYNATDGVVIGFSRIPSAAQYSNFSVTTTNEKYCAISTITTAASTDYYEVVGRFAATLSAGAGYTWSVPTFTASNLIQRPIWNTRLLDYNPAIAFTAGAAPTSPNAGYTVSKYRLSFDDMTIRFYRVYGGAGTTVTSVSIDKPMAHSAEGITDSVGTNISRTVPLALQDCITATTGIIVTLPSIALSQLGFQATYRI